MFRNFRQMVKQNDWRRRITTPPLVLYNVALPLIFIEVWSVLLAFVGIVILEAWVIKTILEEKIKDVIEKIIYINFVTTLIGYLIQGIVRLIILLLVLPAILPRSIQHIVWDNKYIAGLLGNVGSTVSPMRLLELRPSETIIGIATSFMITFILSVFFETRSLSKAYKGDADKQRLILSAVLKANIVSYTVLLIWVLYYIKTH